MCLRCSLSLALGAVLANYFRFTFNYFIENFKAIVSKKLKG